MGLITFPLRLIGAILMGSIQFVVGSLILMVILYFGLRWYAGQ